MRVDPPKPKPVYSEPKPETEEDYKNKQIAALIIVFLGVFYFFFKVVF